MKNFRLLLAYDGSRYRGWQRLGDSENTIQGKLELVISRMVGHPIEVIGSGRTDAGAHALGQVANFHAETDMSAEEVCEYLRRYLPEDIGVMSVTEAQPRFHSRLNAVSKTYRYRIWTAQTPCIFDRKYVWVMRDSLDLDAMRQAASFLTGTHDFLSFCSNKHFKKSSVRTVSRIDLQQTENELVITVSGNGFLYNMVRIIVGTLTAIGRGDMKADEIPAILESRLRENAGETAPPQGLCLMEVLYS